MKNPDDLGFVPDGDAPGAHIVFQRLCHHFRCVRTGRSGPALWVVIGLVADILTILIVREGDPVIDEAIEAPGRKRRFHKRGVAVDAFPIKQRSGHFHHRVAVATGQRELVVGLLVRTCVARCTCVDVFGDKADVSDAQGMEMRSRIEAACPAPDDDGVISGKPVRFSVDLQRGFRHSCLLENNGNRMGAGYRRLM